MEIGEYIKLFGGYAGAIVTILSFMTILIKPLRERFAAWIGKISNRDGINESIADLNTKIDALSELVEKNIQQNVEMQIEASKRTEALKANLRNSILAIYNTRIERGYMTTFELRNIEELYENYKALGGNSFIHSCVERLERLEIRDDQGD